MKTNSQLVKKAKETGNYQNIYPIAYIDGIIDKESNEKLSDILVRYNHILVPWQGSVKATRNRVTLLMRRQGLWITYVDDNSEITTEVYKGSAQDIISNWADDVNWEIVPDVEYVQNNASKIPDGAILPQHLSKELQELLLSSGKVVNLPDGEDLTTQGIALKFKDREYNPELASGKGYKILRKNWTIVDNNNINLLTQDMISDSNTVYEIRYDFNLNGQTITVPEGCVLQFEGGSLNNGTLNLSNTFINGSTGIFKDKLVLEGTVKNIKVELNWFPVDDNTNCTSFLVSLFSIADNGWGEEKRIVELVGGDIIVDPDTIHVKNCSIYGNKCLIRNSSEDRIGSCFIIDDMDAANKNIIQDIYISGFDIGINIQAPISLDRLVCEYNNIGCYLSGPAYSSYIINCRFTNNYYYGLEAVHNDTNNEDHYDTIVQRTYMAGNGRIGAYLHSTHGINIKFSYCDFEANGKMYNQEGNTGFGVVVTAPPQFFLVEHSWFEPEGTPDGVGIVIAGPSDSLFGTYFPEIKTIFDSWGITSGTVYTGKFKLTGNAYLGCNGVALCLSGSMTGELGDDIHTRNQNYETYYPYKIVQSPYVGNPITINNVSYPSKNFIGISRTPIYYPQFKDGSAGIEIALKNIKYNGNAIYNYIGDYALFHTGTSLQLSNDGNIVYIPESTIKYNELNSPKQSIVINLCCINDMSYSNSHNIMMPRFVLDEQNTPVDLSNKYLIIVGDGGLYWYFNEDNTLVSQKLTGPVDFVKIPTLGENKEIYFNKTFIRAFYMDEEDFKSTFNTLKINLQGEYYISPYVRHDNYGFWKYEDNAEVMIYKAKDTHLSNSGKGVPARWRNSDGTLTSKVSII